MTKALARATIVVATLLLAATAGMALAQQRDGVHPAPGAAARDPFVPPRDLYAAQDLPALRVTVIGYNREHPQRSMAVVRLETHPPLRRVVYRGDRVGEYRILQIEPTRVVAAAPVFGGTSRISLSVGDTTTSSR
jgi:hypothetical protein